MGEKDNVFSYSFIFLFSLAAYSLDKVSDVVIFSGDLDINEEKLNQQLYLTGM